jgi:hypothetical protein
MIQVSRVKTEDGGEALAETLRRRDFFIAPELLNRLLAEWGWLIERLAL